MVGKAPHLRYVSVSCLALNCLLLGFWDGLFGIAVVWDVGCVVLKTDVNFFHISLEISVTFFLQAEEEWVAIERKGTLVLDLALRLGGGQGGNPSPKEGGGEVEGGERDGVGAREGGGRAGGKGGGRGWGGGKGAFCQPRLLAGGGNDEKRSLAPRFFPV